MSEHPITPPQELVKQWRNSWHHVRGEFGMYIATQAARWGWKQRDASVADELQKARDEELEACVEWLWKHQYDIASVSIRAARRPKPPSFAEDALKALQDQIDTSFKISSEAQERANTIRAALERLKELEQLND